MCRRRRSWRCSGWENNMKPYSLYIHIPFCAKKCNYCDFTSYAGMEHFISPYIAAVGNEIKTYSQALERPWLKSIYFGGGTPSLIPESAIEEILRAVSANFNYKENMEVSLEANPGTVNLAKLAAYRKAGINRLSIGAQSFSDDRLRLLGRVHTASQIAYTVNAARSAGFKNINLDLIFALPGQDVIDWGNTLKKAVSLSPEHISAYNLVIEEGTPFHGQKDKLPLPTDEEEAMMYEETIDLLTSLKYEHYEISNFARPGARCENNLTYWRNEEYIGIGAGATSYIKSSRYANPTDIEAYISEWNFENFIILQERHGKNLQTLKQMFSETMFLGLRLTEGIDLTKLTENFGRDALKEHKNDLRDLVNEDLISIDERRLRLTKRGLFLANEVFRRFV